MQRTGQDGLHLGSHHPGPVYTIKTAYVQFCTGVATQAVHISTIIRARSLYFTPIMLTDTRMHCIFRLRATGHHHFGHNTVKYIELCVCPHQWQHRVKWYGLGQRAPVSRRRPIVAWQQDLDNYPSCHCWDVSSAGIVMQLLVLATWVWTITMWWHNL